MLTAANFTAYRRVNAGARNKKFDENRAKENKIKTI